MDVINFALQSVQYIGNENYYGEDTIRISTKNMNGVNKLEIPIFVEAINDPPFIHAPEFIMLKSNEDESLIFNIERDKFKFSIGDPDLPYFPGGQTYFTLAFAVEVSDGLLVTSLPAELISSTELRFKNSHRWQPLQTYVTISKHFTVEANGLRFRGKVNDCNSVMQTLFYRAGEQGADLTITVGVGSILVFSLGVVLLLFTCKCAILLVHERSRSKFEASNAQRSQKQTPSESGSLAGPDIAPALPRVAANSATSSSSV